MPETVTRKLEGIGVGPTAKVLKRFLEGAADPTNIKLEHIPQDRPFDPEGWRISYTETIAEDAVWDNYGHPFGSQQGQFGDH